MQETDNKKEMTVIVLGMARCGTSATAGILRILGVEMGKEEEPNPNNPKGSLEDPDFAKLNKEILYLAKENSSGLPQHDRIMQLKGKFQEKIKNLIAEKSQKSKIWGWKSPASSLTIELFLPYLKNPHFVIVFRNPLRAAKSMTAPTSRAHNMPIEQAIQTISAFNKEIMEFVSRHAALPKLYITFEDIIKNPVSEAKRISNFINLDKPAKKQIKAINKFVVPRHKIQRARKMAGILFRPRRFIKKCFKNPREVFCYIGQLLKNNIKIW